MEQHHMLSRPNGDFHALQHLDSPQLLHKPKQSPFDSHPTHGAAQQLPPAYAPPPSYAQAHHDPARLDFPDAPSTELPPIQPATAHHEAEHHLLPSLSSLTGPQSQRLPPPPHAEPAYNQPAPAAAAAAAAAPVTHWPSLNPFTTYYTPSHAQAADSPARMDVDVSSNSAVSAASPDRLYDGRASSVSLDDPDVRIAAEALGNLRAADVISSPPNRHISVPLSPPPMSEKTQAPQQEPLLYLLTATHPLVATTIEGAQSAYNTSKNYSPRFKSSAEYVEGYLTPIANTVGSVSRVTGVEGGVRWILGASKNQQSASSDLETGDRPRERMDIDAAKDAPMSRLAMVAVAEEDSARDPYVFKHDRRLSMASTIDTLPAYDDNHSPAYTETDVSRRPTSNSAWQSRLIMSTSGLSIAMSEESLRSLKYCLRWLRWANDHIGKIIATLKSTLEQFDRSESQRQEQEQADGDVIMGDQEDDAAARAQDRSIMAARIASLKSDVLKTLKDVIETVSKYAGGALPENARVLVRRHLTSLPQRFRLANQLDAPAAKDANGEAEQGEQHQEKELRDGAQRVLVLAKEGLDMMAQVSGVVDGTIVSAEEWCERLGRKKRDERGNLLPSTPTNGDVKTG